MELFDALDDESASHLSAVNDLHHGLVVDIVQGLAILSL